MKFVVISRHKDSLYSLPAQTRAEVIKGATAFVDKYLKAGKCKDIYFHGDMKGTVSIWELQSSEESARLTLENPMSTFQYSIFSTAGTINPGDPSDTQIVPQTLIPGPKVRIDIE